MSVDLWQKRLRFIAEKLFPFSVVCSVLETNLNLFALDNNWAWSLWCLMPVSVTRPSSIAPLNIISKLSEPHQQQTVSTSPSSLKSCKIWGYQVTRQWNIEAILLGGYHHLACCLMNNTLTGLYTDTVVMCSIFYDTLGHWDRCNTDSVSHILWLSAPLPPS